MTVIKIVLFTTLGSLLFHRLSPHHLTWWLLTLSYQSLGVWWIFVTRLGYRATMHRFRQDWHRLTALTAGLLFAGCVAATPPPAPLPPAPPPPPPKAEIVIPPDPAAGLNPQILAAINRGDEGPIVRGDTTYYAYDPDLPPINLIAQAFHPNEIRLNSDETVSKDSIVLGDITGWRYNIGDHVVWVEPLGDTKDINMTTTLDIATSQGRYYHFHLRLGRKPTGPVAYYYSDDFKRQQAARDAALMEAKKENQ